MDARIAKLCLCLLVATFATGCTTLRGFLPTHSATTSTNPGNTNSVPSDTGAVQPNSIPGGTVIAASGQGVPQPNTLPAPRSVPQAPLTPPPGWPPGVPVPPTGQGQGQPYPGMPQPGTPGMPGDKPPSLVDPHLRVSPTVTGGRLNLAPYEVPTDRVVELSKQLELALAQNRDLLARIKELEALGIGREQALAEAVREIDAITAASAKERTALQAQLLRLQGQIKQMEEEDVIFLRAVIDALSKLLPPEKK